MKININIDSKKHSISLGMGANHDFSGCIVKNGQVINAIPAERVNRLKHSLYAFNPFRTVLKYLFPNGKVNIKHLAIVDTLDPKYYIKYLDKVRLYNHHLCHAAAVFFTSPFQKASIFVVDGTGSKCLVKGDQYRYETYSYYRGESKDINLIKQHFGEVDDSLDETHYHEVYIPNSLGLFYNHITKIIGFKFLNDGKTMGISSYGDPSLFYQEFIKAFSLEGEGIVNNNFGKEHVIYYSTLIEKAVNEKTKFKLKADIAAGAQKVLEECYFFCLNYLHKKTKCDNLCISGGVGLNSIANGKIRSKTPFKNVFLFPACGDDSTAVGAALLANLSYKKQTRVIIPKQSPFLGKKYTDESIRKSLKEANLKYYRSKDKYKKAAKLLSEGKIIGWFQGGSEFGPRALGHRSIIVDSRREEMKDFLNEKVKHRESFRPFASAILYEYIEEYFDHIKWESPYMLEVFPVKKEKNSKIPAVIHVDGTGRIQTVNKENTELYYLIKEFYNITKVPVILNTSFNIKGEPIVETPTDAINSFLACKMDVLFLNDYFISKETVK